MLAVGHDRYLGIDLGTSGLKVALVDPDGGIVGESEAEYAVDSPRPGWAETDPSAWVDAMRSALAALAPVLRRGRVGGVGVTGQMHGTVLCDGAGRALRPAVLWPDRRAEDEVALWRKLPKPLRARLANPLVPGMTGPTLRWLLDHEPAAARAEVVLLPKDHLRHGLAGPPVTDRTDASATLLWDVVADTWSADTLEATGLPPWLLPRVVGCDDVVGETDVLTEWGGPRGVPVVAGCADTPAAMLAAGARQPGARQPGARQPGARQPGAREAGAREADVVQVNLGTGAQVLRAVERAVPRADPPVHLYADADRGWYAMAAVRNAGLALEWVRRIFGADWPELFAIAAGASPGSGGVSFLPFLTGERGGIAGPDSRGAWIGMSTRTSRDDLIRAAVEAMAFCVRRAVELLDARGRRVRLTGGGGRDHGVQRLLADVLGVPVTRVDVRSASATGAAMLAARGVGGRLETAPRLGPEISPAPAEALDDAYRTWLSRLPHPALFPSI